MWSRREVLKQLGIVGSWSAAGAYGFGTGVAAAATHQVLSIPFAFSLYGMRTLPLDRALRVCADIGYSGVELPCMPEWPCDPAVLGRSARRQLRDQLKALSLQLPAIMENLRLIVPAEQHRQNLERLKLAAELANDLQVGDQPPIIETVLGGRPDQWLQEREPMARALADWERVVRDARVVLAVKAHVSNALHRPEDVLWLLRQVNSPWVKAAYDYSHFERQGLALRPTLGVLLPQTVFVHIKDNITTADGKTEFALPGDGQTNYGEYLKQLLDGNYPGAVCVEVSAQVFNKPGYNPIIAAERCYLQLRTAFEQVGLRARA